MINMTLTVRDITLAIVQKAGRNLKRQALGLGSEEGGTASGGVDAYAGVLCIVEPFPGGNLERMESSAFAEVNFFILLDSF